MGYDEYPEKYKAIADISLKLAYSPACICLANSVQPEIDSNQDTLDSNI